MSVMGLLAANGRATGSVQVPAARRSWACRPSELNRIRGARMSMIFQDPMTSLNPYLTIEPPADRGAGDPQRHVAKRGAARRPSPCWSGCRSPRRDRRISPLSPRILRRHAPARDDRHGAALPAGAADRRRADHGPRRHRAGPDPGADGRAASSAGKTAFVVITHDLGVIAGLCDRVLVMYAGRVVETGPVRDIFKSPQHPYTAGLLRLHAAAGRDARRTRLADHPGPAAQSAAPAAGLRLQRPLPPACSSSAIASARPLPPSRPGG